MKRFVMGLSVLLLTLLFSALALGQASAQSPVIAEYPVPGSPLHIAVESPGRVWATMPSQNSVVRLIVASDGTFTTTNYQLPQPNSEPYDLALAGDAVWVSERAGQRIGRLDKATGGWTEFAITPTIDSRPAGIAVLSGTSTQVWFAGQDSDSLGQLVITSTTEYTLTEYPIPAVAAGDPEDIAIDRFENIWFSVPNASRIGALVSPYELGIFETVYTDSPLLGIAGSRPWSIVMEDGIYPWVTDRAFGRVGKYRPGTITDLHWIYLPPGGGGSAGLALGPQGEWLWYTRPDAGRAGEVWRRAGWPYPVLELSLPPESKPWGLASDSKMCQWIADSGRDQIARWCPPFFPTTFLPLVGKF